jgi:hypothetical protein
MAKRKRTKNDLQNITQKNKDSAKFHSFLNGCFKHIDRNHENLEHVFKISGHIFHSLQEN